MKYKRRYLWDNLAIRYGVTVIQHDNSLWTGWRMNECITAFHESRLAAENETLLALLELAQSQKLPKIEGWERGELPKGLKT